MKRKRTRSTIFHFLSANDSISSESSFISSIRNTTFSGLLDAPMTGQVEVDVNEDSLHPPSASSPNKSFKLNSTLGPDSQWMGGEVSVSVDVMSGSIMNILYLFPFH